MPEMQRTDNTTLGSSRLLNLPIEIRHTIWKELLDNGQTPLYMCVDILFLNPFTSQKTEIEGEGATRLDQTANHRRCRLYSNFLGLEAACKTLRSELHFLRWMLKWTGRPSSVMFCSIECGQPWLGEHDLHDLCRIEELKICPVYRNPKSSQNRGAPKTLDLLTMESPIGFVEVSAGPQYRESLQPFDKDSLMPKLNLCMLKEPGTFLWNGKEAVVFFVREGKERIMEWYISQFGHNQGNKRKDDEATFRENRHVFLWMGRYLEELLEPD